VKTNLIFEGKKSGWIDGDTFFAIRTKEHFFWKYGGWGSSTSILSELQKRGIKNFCVIYRANMSQVKEYKCKVVDFYNYGNKFIDNSNGFEDPQLVLNIKLWNKDDKLITETQSKLVAHA